MKHITMDDVCETETYHDLQEASNREYELNIKYGYKNQTRKYADFFNHFQNQHKKSPRTKKGAKHTEESKQKMSDTRRQLGLKPMLGKKHTPEARKKMADAHLGKKRDDDWKKNIRNGVRNATSQFTPDDIRDIRKMAEDGIKQTIIADKYNASKMTISRIVRRVTFFDIE